MKQNGICLTDSECSFLRKTREGKLIPGYGGVDKYYK